MRTRPANSGHAGPTPGDRHRLFTAIGAAVPSSSVLYPGSYVDIAASFVFDDVTYVDIDRRAAQFFDDHHGVDEIIAQTSPTRSPPEWRFINADYTSDLQLPAATSTSSSPFTPASSPSTAPAIYVPEGTSWSTPATATPPWHPSTPPTASLPSSSPVPVTTRSPMTAWTPTSSQNDPHESP